MVQVRISDAVFDLLRRIGSWGIVFYINGPYTLCPFATNAPLWKDTRILSTTVTLSRLYLARCRTKRVQKHLFFLCEVFIIGWF